MNSFHAYRIFDETGKSAGRFVELSLDDLSPGEVVIQARYSSVNYKDALAATGAGKIIRRFPCVGGVDVAGVVVSSSDASFKAGDEVLVTGYDMGVAHDGGYAEFVRVPAAWVVPLPSGLSLFEAMALGTAGFTAALAIYRLQQNELSPEKGKVIVTGASGGVGSLAVNMLSQLGYHVVAMTGKDSAHDYLKSIGASEILARSGIDFGGQRALEKAQWAGALDSAGGDTLAWLLRGMQPNGAVASFGNAGGVELHTSVFPFILRGVKLLGIDSAATAMSLRKKIWRKLADDLFPRQILEIVTIAEFSQLPELFDKIIHGKMRGRAVVKISGG
ncbi:MAG: YhdH/YhfP family quinone oxidoreductase [Gallionellaceae bacterium]|jgi:NADPH2:quinone reductase